jgi:hypothetical protein
VVDRKNLSDVSLAEERKFGSKATDKELVDTVNSWVKESESYHQELLKAQEASLKYYRGDQTDRDQIPEYNSNVVHNRIFEGAETIVPIISGQAHEFVAMPGNESEVSLMLAQKVQNVLQLKFEDLDIRERIEEVVRDVVLKRFGCLEYFWDFDKDDVGVEVLDPRTILIPKLRTNPEGLPYVIKILEFTDQELMEQFDLKKEEILSNDREIDTGTQDSDVKTRQVYEVWTDLYVVWKLGDKILRKEANPNWNFDGDNFLQKPEIPIVFIAPFRTGEAPISSISLAEVVMPIQDDINDQKRQINNNLKKMGNGQIYLDDDTVEEEKEDEITSEPGLIIRGKGIASENRIKREPGLPLPASHFQNLIESNSSFDAVFGVQPAVRGAAQSPTLGGQIMNRQQNLTRIELLTREMNRGTDRLVNGVVQLMKLYYNERRVFKMIGKNEAIMFFEFLNDDIENDLVIRAKSGRAFIADPEQRANRAIQLWQLGALDPLTLYREVGFPNPEETTERLQAWLTGQLVQQTQADIVSSRLGATPKPAGPEGAGRKVETNTNSVQRSEQNISGGPTKLPNTPK